MNNCLFCEKFTKFGGDKTIWTWMVVKNAKQSTFKMYIITDYLKYF